MLLPSTNPRIVCSSAANIYTSLSRIQIPPDAWFHFLKLVINGFLSSLLEQTDRT